MDPNDKLNPVGADMIKTLPGGVRIRQTFYGEVSITPAGDVFIVAGGNETYNWAHKAGAAWPCSDLSGHAVEVAIAANGDLIDMEGGGGVTSAELDAFTSDLISFIVDAHPGMRP